MSNRVKDKVAIVTGAAQGIGFGCAQMLAQEGASVVVADVNESKGIAAAERIRAAGGRAIFHKTDVTCEADCASVVEKTMQTFGKLNVLVNNAGWFARATIDQIDDALWDKYLNINLRGPFYLCKHAIPKMQANSAAGESRGSGSCGSIINIGTTHGIQAQASLIAYGIAKGGLLTLTRTLAGQYAKDRIRANYIIPGWVLSEGEMALQASQGNDAVRLSEIGATLPLGRHQTPQDTAYAVVFLASDESAQITGMILHIDAGYSVLPIKRDT
jgi:hypothetical protein